MCIFLLTFPGGIAFGSFVLLFPVAGFVTGLCAVLMHPQDWFAWTAFTLNTVFLTVFAMMVLGMLR